MHATKARLEAWGTGHARERTQNMLLMSVTLDVLKLSGWLNAVAYCRVERRKYDEGRGADREAGGPREVAAQAASTGRA